MARSGTKRFFIVLGIVVVLSGLWVTAVAISGFSSGFWGGGSSDYDEELLVEGDSTAKVAMINVIGEIFSDPGGGIDRATDTNIIKQLEIAEDDPDVKAIILNLETPGGTVVASDNIYNKVRAVNDDKPVIALMNDIAASGGYYIAAGASEIVAHPSTWTGSIGVIAMIPNLEETTGKLGIKLNVVKSGALKDLGSPFRPMTDQERGIFQALIDEAYDGFVDVVVKGRELTPERTRELADGRIYSGKQAKELDLVDHLGDRDFAFGRAKGLGKASGASLVVYRRVGGLFDDLIPFVKAPNAAEIISEELGVSRSPGAAYLWVP
ncbi:MAG: signal peptide peptidase SppA [Actinomycetota bacterium]